MPTYGVLGFIGLGAGFVLACILTLATQASLVALALTTVSGLVAAYLFTVAVRAVVGRELLVFYHYLFLVSAVGVAVLSLGGWPLLPHLEPLVLGLGLLQAVGRWGCLAAGCCHGRPVPGWLHPLAVVYGPQHAERGFPRRLLGLPLLAVQALESAWILTCLAVATVTALEGTAGSGLVVYLLAVPTGRFVFELLRGDPHRPYLRGLSEAQWTSLVLVGGTVALVFAGFLPAEAPATVFPAPAFLAALLAAALVFLALGARATALRAPRRASAQEDARG